MTRLGMTAAFGAIAALCMVIPGIPAVAQRDPPKVGGASAGKLSGADRSFMREAAIGGMAEVTLGKLAQQKGSNAAVKQFGGQMVTDHSKANDELKSLAQQKGVPLPATLDAKHKAIEAKLSRLSGAAFDSAYAKAMVDDHKEDVAHFRTRSKNAKDGDLRSWAGKTLPTLEHHLQMAQQMASKVNTRKGSR
jgi:putative membrane protein